MVLHKDLLAAARERRLSFQQSPRELLKFAGAPLLGAAAPLFFQIVPPEVVVGEVLKTPEEQGMGFFSGLVKTVVGIGRGLLGLPPKVAAVARAAPRAAAVAGGAIAAGGLTAAALAAGAAGPATGMAIPGGAFVNPATGELVAAAGGNGVLVTTTMVTTVNRVTGQIVKQRIFLGSPFLMNKEVAHLKSTSKKLLRGARRVPTRTRKASTRSLITDAIEDSILHQAQRGAAAALGSAHKDA